MRSAIQSLKTSEDERGDPEAEGERDELPGDKLLHPDAMIRRMSYLVGPGKRQTSLGNESERIKKSMIRTSIRRYGCNGKQ